MTRFFVGHPVTTWMIFLAFVVLAVYALPRIEIEALPEVDLPSLTVETRWQGASPKAVQRALNEFVGRTTNWLYDHLRFVNGYDQVIWCRKIANRNEFPMLRARKYDNYSLARRAWKRFFNNKLLIMTTIILSVIIHPICVIHVLFFLLFNAGKMKYENYLL